MIQDKTDPVGLCPYCGKQIKEESATVYIGGETCAIFLFRRMYEFIV